MAELSPYLFFNGNCKEAMEFYKSVLGGNVEYTMVEGSPMAEHMPAEARNGVLHSDFRNEHIHFMASDMYDPSLAGTGSVNLCLFSEDKEEIKRLYEAMAEGGEKTDPLKEEYFGSFGALTDKFGKRWMFQGGKMV